MTSQCTMWEIWTTVTSLLSDIMVCNDILEKMSWIYIMLEEDLFLNVTQKHEIGKWTSDSHSTSDMVYFKC